MKKALFLFLVVSAFNLTGLLAQNRDKSVKWEKEITAFEKADSTNPPPKNGIEFVGSSSIRKWVSLEKDFVGYPVFNRGFGGSSIIDSYNFASRIILPYAPKKIFFHAGDNDLASGKTAELVFEDFKKLIGLVLAKLPKTDIYYISLKPSEKRWKLRFDEQKVNNYIQEYVKSNPRLHYIDTYSMVIDAEGKPRAELFASDQLHLSEAGYKLLADEIRPFLVDGTTKPPLNQKK
jgi:lysophospholipase L1-like esterase